MNDQEDIKVSDEQVIDQPDQLAQSSNEQEQSVAATSYKQSKDSTKLAMSVKVYSPFRDYFDGQAFSISGENLTGPFDILPKHHSFISLLTPCELTIRTPSEDSKGPIKIRIGGGLMHVKADQVIVFLDV
ncbi:MAG TPA: hypothetical protein VLF63_01250 [Patescibacteria group bacterium]|nr:hypothetical protein [Patescibacteria group bacterium]